MDSLDPKAGFFMKFISFLPSKPKIFLYRLMGAKIGKHVTIGIGSTIVARDYSRVKIGDYSVIDSFAMLICDEIELGEDCHIGPFVWIYGGSLLWMIPRECKFRMGNVTYVGARSIINVTENVTIGDYTGIGAGTTIYTHGFQASYIDGEPRKEAPVAIGSHVWVQPKTIILPGVSIGDGSIIGSGSVVTKDVPAHVFAVGCPCAAKSDVSALKKGNSVDEREQRTMKVINDYLAAMKFLKKGRVHIENTSPTEWVLTLRKYFGIAKKKYRIVYERSLDEKSAEKAAQYRECVLIISLLEIPAGVENKLAKNNVVWIDLSRKRIFGRDRLPPLFYSLLRDYYGVGLVSAGNSANGGK